jgi:hypothetical protein
MRCPKCGARQAVIARQCSGGAGESAGPMIKPSSYNTVQELIDGGYTVTIYCHNPRCHRRAELNRRASVPQRPIAGPSSARL